MGVQIISHRNFNYDGRVLIPGQVIERGYYRNDESLIKHHYIEELGTPVKNLEHCDQCGRDFATRSYYEDHTHMHAGEKREAVAASGGKVKRLEEEFPGGIVVEAGGGLKSIKEV